MTVPSSRSTNFDFFKNKKYEKASAAVALPFYFLSERRCCEFFKEKIDKT
jgi:hypothetical protein